MNQDTEHLNTLTSIRDYIRWSVSQFQAAQLFYGHGTASALDEAVALILHTLHLPYELPESYFDATLTYQERERITTIVLRRVNEQIPAAYLTHEAIFCGLKFFVDNNFIYSKTSCID
jgi:ribosomal protein L3 glutamine methyltransferase